MTEIVWVYNIAGVRTAAVPNPSGLQVDERLQQSETLSFSVRADYPVANYIDDDRIVQYGASRYRITELDQGRAGAAVTWDVTADALWIDLLGFPATTTPIVGVTPAQGLDTILAGTGWTVGTVDVPGGSFSMDVSLDETALGLVRAWAGICSREIVFDTIGKTVSLLTEQGADRGLGFTYGRNLIGVKRKIQPPQCTRLYAYGGNDLSISAVNPTGKPYVEDFSYYTDQGLSLPEAEAQYLKVQRWTDQRYLLATNLLDAATARLATLSKPLISYEATVADLSAIVGTGETFLMGDIVRVRDTPTGIDVSARIVRKVTKPLEPDKTTVELGFLIDPTISQQTSTAGATTAGDVSLLLDQNTSPYAIAAGQVQVNKISLGVDPLAGVANGVFGSEIDGTATGTGTVTVSFWLNATPVGPTVQVPFVAGPVHIGVPDFLAGLSESADFIVKMQVTSGTGTLSIPVNGAHLYIFATGLAGGGVDTNPEVIIAEGVVYTAPVVASGDELVSPALYTPVSASPADAVDTTPAGVADGGALITNMLYRGSASGSTTSGTSVNVTIPSAAVIGDQMRLAVATPSAATHTTPSGWALERSDTGAGTNGLRTSVFRRTVGSGDPGATQTVAVSSSTNIVAAVYVLGGTSTTPENIDGATGSSADDTTATAPSVTTTVAGCWILRIVASLAAAAAADAITTSPVNRAAITHAAGLSLALSDEQAQAAAGATGTASATLAASAAWTATTIALAP